MKISTAVPRRSWRWESPHNSIHLAVWVPRCRIVYDKFHIMQHANDAVDEVRRAEFFRKGPDDAASIAALTKLAGAMTSPKDPADPKDGVDPEEGGIPAAYTYLGQFWPEVIGVSTHRST